MSRQKECFTSRELPHKWAHEAQLSGRVSGGNESFRDGGYYSYAACIARIIHYKGRKAFIVDNARFSVTTSGHQSNCRRAIPDSEKKFFVHAGWNSRGTPGVYQLEFTPRKLRDYYLHEAKPSGEKHKLAFRNAQDVCSRYNSLVEAIGVCQFFKLPTKRLFKLLEKFNPEVLAAQALLEARRLRLNEAAAKRDAAKLAKRIARATEIAQQVVNGEVKYEDAAHIETSILPPELAEKYATKTAEFNAAKIARWLAGENVGLDHDCPTLLRVVYVEPTPPFIETSRGARIPYADGERAFRFYLAKRKAGWHRNGEKFRVGDYQLDACGENGIVAGCNRISHDEIIRFATEQKWWDGDTSDDDSHVTAGEIATLPPAGC